MNERKAKKSRKTAKANEVQQDKAMKEEATTFRKLETMLLAQRDRDRLWQGRPLSPQAIERIGSIPLMFKDSDLLQRTGSLIYDSWADKESLALRDITAHCVRHIILKAEKISLEIVAERRRRDWEFVARVYMGQKAVHDFVLKAGNRKLLPATGGFFRWTSKYVPRTVRLVSYRYNLAFEKLAW